MAHPPPLGSFSDRPTFNTKAVARESGVPADTFRAWERRYGVPRPQRTAGAHRLYSERDIAIIRWLRDRTTEGVNISQAVQLLAATLESQSEPYSESALSFDRLRGDLVTALISFNSADAERLIGGAFALYPFEAVLLDLLQPVMVEIGERWQRGEISVAAEHFASQFVRRKLSGLLNVFEGSARHTTIIVGCAPNELHDLGALMCTLLLMRRGWHVIFLGAQVPLADLVAAAQALRPALICLSAATSEAAISLGEVAHAVQLALPNVLFGYGGRAFNIDPQLREPILGTFLGQNAREFVGTVTSLLRADAAASQERILGRNS